ncbi:Clp protease N-terminal domain-containing protein [Kitasatospora kifunensis]|uniref:Clp R domain-containing protein n=1 Tax=Kitasatospora kifunensis TaxID=58351 RepID=A0A7W7VYU6_KITKI|nr:Clp protease N-terminal domain-containing protein [Kitasatospora kifunensis]MBB4927418.1 hypothetical protein [Kitasatospora kifunensis]
MFHGDDPELVRILRRARAAARDLGHPRVGSEHLLLALTLGGDKVAGVLARSGATSTALHEPVRAAAPWGAGAAADRGLMASLGIDLDRILQNSDVTTWDQPVGHAPVLPLGAGNARRRCARVDPPLGVDAQAVYEASLRLALARRERQHRSEHLALALVSLDPGVDWALTVIAVDRRSLMDDLAAAFPPPGRNPLLRVERRLGHRLRHRHLVQRYQHLTGRTAVEGVTAARLIAG